VNEAIEKGIYPILIRQGSSGSYFCRDKDGVILGVFKPKNEEPYGHLNPKWTKWIHRNLFPCFFGRSCIIPNLGYISEAATSLVGRRLGMDIVPRTEIVSLASPSFHYSSKDRKKNVLPKKVGSFQLFLKDFQGADCVICDVPHSSMRWSFCSSNQLVHLTDSLDDTLKSRLKLEFEQLVILDFIIRNTGKLHFIARSWI
jgi:phosphatidylinositol 4-kinase type 2